jgi:hypothetical protein
MFNKLNGYKLALIAGVLAPLSAMATDDPNIVAANGIITTATTTFGTVAALVVSIVGFYVIVKLVRGVSGH